MWLVSVLMLMMVWMSSLVRWCATTTAAAAAAIMVYTKYVRFGPGHTALGLGVGVAPGG